jgi:hypothetical protein
MLFVSINYRLNIFSFGDGKEKNLALKDQRLGIEWVRKNIASFGGDPVSTSSTSACVTDHSFPSRTISPCLVKVLGLSIPMHTSSRVRL